MSASSNVFMVTLIFPVFVRTTIVVGSSLGKMFEVKIFFKKSAGHRIHTSN